MNPSDPTRFDVDQEDAVDVVSESIFQKLPARCGCTYIGGLRPRFDLGDEAGTVALYQRIGAKIDGNLFIVEFEFPRLSRLGGDDRKAPLPEQVEGGAFAALGTPPPPFAGAVAE